MNKLTLFGIVIGGIGYLVGMWLIHKGNANESKSENNKLNYELETHKNQLSQISKMNHTLEGKIDELNAQNSEQNTVLTKLRENNNKLNQDLRKAQSTIISKFIGDDNYGIIDFSLALCGDDYCYQLNFRNISEEPIYDVQVRYYDVEESERSLKNGISTIETHKSQITKNIGNITPNLSTPISEFKLCSKNGDHYVFYIGTRNGIYYQELFLFPKKNGYVASIERIMKYNNDIGKFEEIRNPYNHSSDFPIKKEDVKWKLDFG